MNANQWIDTIEKECMNFYVKTENRNLVNRTKLDELKMEPYEINNNISNIIYKTNSTHKNLN